MPRTRIKICGIRTPEGAHAAIDAGADALGFVFHRASPRSIEPVDAWDIVKTLPPLVHSVGLTVNADFDEFEEIESYCPTDYSQLHGAESIKLVRACGPRVIKAVRFDAATIEADLERWAGVEEVDAILVDGSAGGGGVALDWAALARARSKADAKPLFLAGGLTPDNVAQAVRVVRPFAVDVSSGVEDPSQPGVKDPARIAAFCGAVRAADRG